MRKELSALLLLALVMTGCAGKSASPPANYDAQRQTAPTPSTPMPPDMNHQGAPENRAISPLVEPQSTFSVDVDTASYTLVRSYLERGNLPPAAAVRTEELINYFPQTYPVGSGPVSLFVDGGPSPFRPGSHLVQIGLQARPVTEEERKPARLTFVVDVSGSMDRENRLGLVKRSLTLLLGQLRPSDQIGLVVYGTRGRILQEQVTDKERIRRAIEALQPEGSTNVEEGLTLGYELASRSFDRSAINRVILCSDGVANVGVTGPDALLKRIEDYKQQGITLTTVGFGMGNFNDVLMEQLADKGDGQYAYVDTLQEAERIFGAELSGTLQVVAKDTKVQVEFDPAQVRSYRLVGYENRAMSNDAFKDNAADAGEMGAGHSVTALYELELADEGSVIGKVSVRYKEPNGEVRELSTPIRRPRLGATAQLTWNASIAEFAGILRGSPWSAGTTWSNLLSVARDASSDLEGTEAHREALGLMETARRLKRGQ